MGTVTLNKYDPNTGYQGLPAANQKQAEQNAAENCLKELKDVVEKLRSEHEAKKKAKMHEQLAALKEKTKEKQASGAKSAGLETKAPPAGDALEWCTDMKHFFQGSMVFCCGHPKNAH